MHNITSNADPRPFLRHMALASLWCQYNGQKGTEKQTLRVMRQLTADDLVRMLGERGVVVKESQSAHGVAVSGE